MLERNWPVSQIWKWKWWVNQVLKSKQPICQVHSVFTKIRNFLDVTDSVCYNHAIKYLKSFNSKLYVQVYTGTGASIHVHKISTRIPLQCFQPHQQPMIFMVYSGFQVEMSPFQYSDITGPEHLMFPALS